MFNGGFSRRPQKSAICQKKCQKKFIAGTILQKAPATP
jgi:hypothetical protein